MISRSTSLWKSLDWWTILIYILLVIFGWFSVCGASYEYGNPEFFDYSTRAGKQLIWILCSFGLGFILIMLDDTFYRNFSYIIYIGMILLLIVTIFIAPDVKGSRSWLVFGPVSLQPAEFGKFATALALARYMNATNFSMKKPSNALMVGFFILLPVMLIILQKETGSALVYLTFFLVLYREGMPGVVLFLAVAAVLYFIVGIRFDQVFFDETTISIGEFSVIAVALFFTGAMCWVFKKNIKACLNIVVTSALVIGGGYAVGTYLIPFNYIYVQYFCVGLTLIYLVYLSFKDRKWAYSLIATFLIGSVAFLYSIDYVFNEVLEPHQRVRIEIVLGMEEDLAGAGYNVNQSKIAIGSGGMTGKGFLNGTQTKLKYVPEQDTDFIFCTVGEEQGFVGSATVLVLYLFLILRLIALSERQSSTFCRVYGYSVLSVFLFHLFINIGMVLGLTPVIGIPLPFFSYGGSSLWGFTILLFVFLRLDAGRARRLNG
ncbi:MULTISPECIES: rod shape-determining protein RodA [Bacteroides]|uniref:rod shape-determining protein RodA n=1 Tax=Bacteroides TaxID=816 RepID=UPI001D1E11A1|nr:MULTISPECIES: rod shape-determining protein RodA [Bacteroides]HJD92359.1 rod shape-determining protein RodA [Bacteroides coprosuis]